MPKIILYFPVSTPVLIKLVINPTIKLRDNISLLCYLCLNLSFDKRSHHHSVRIFYANHKADRTINDGPENSQADVDLWKDKEEVIS